MDDDVGDREDLRGRDVLKGGGDQEDELATVDGRREGVGGVEVRGEEGEPRAGAGAG